jgi:hypothetical protein
MAPFDRAALSGVKRMDDKLTASAAFRFKKCQLRNTVTKKKQMLLMGGRSIR